MAGIWPGDTQCVASLTFDVDGVSSWLARDPQFSDFKSLMSMAEYGPSVGVPRILDLLDTHSIKASFYVPGYVAETHVDMVKDIVSRGHEVGHHGYIHEAPATLSAEEEESVLEKGITILHEITGQKPRGYRSPSWELSTRSLPLLAAYDFLYDTSLMGDDAPYLVDAGMDGEKLVELPIHWLLDDAAHFTYAPAAKRFGPIRNTEEVYKSWSAEFDGIYRFGRSFNLTMHPQLIGRPGRLLMLDRLISYIREFPNVEFMRCEDVARLFVGD